MNNRLQVQLNMVGACITVAQSSDYKPVWNGKPPADFGTDIVQLATDYGAVTAKAAQADAATGGAADAKAVAETALEDAAFVLARALANHFKKTGDLDRHGKVDVSKSEIMKLRTQELVNKTTAIRDLGTAAVSEAGAAGRGVTAARVAALTAAITGFSKTLPCALGATHAQPTPAGAPSDAETGAAHVMVSPRHDPTHQHPNAEPRGRSVCSCFGRPQGGR